MKVRVTEYAIVVATPSCNVGYPPGVWTAPRAHIEQIEAQGKGERLPQEAQPLVPPRIGPPK